MDVVLMLIVYLLYLLHYCICNVLLTLQVLVTIITWTLEK